MCVCAYVGECVVSCVCAYCVCACARACVRAYVLVCVRACVRACVHVCVRVRVYVYVRACMCVCAHTACMHTCMHNYIISNQCRLSTARPCKLYVNQCRLGTARPCKLYVNQVYNYISTLSHCTTSIWHDTPIHIPHLGHPHHAIHMHDDKNSYILPMRYGSYSVPSKRHGWVVM